jgi:hypothetical protein
MFEDLSTDIEKIRKSVANYYPNIYMTKVKYENGYSIYYAKIRQLISIEEHYIIAISEENFYPLNATVPLESVKWISFQTRIIKKCEYKIKGQALNLQTANETLHSQINLKERKIDRFVYLSEEYPITVELLKSKSGDVFAEKGTIKGCLDTFSCIINFLY